MDQVGINAILNTPLLWLGFLNPQTLIQSIPIADQNPPINYNNNNPPIYVYPSNNNINNPYSNTGVGNTAYVNPTYTNPTYGTYGQNNPYNNDPSSDTNPTNSNGYDVNNKIPPYGNQFPQPSSFPYPSEAVNAVEQPSSGRNIQVGTIPPLIPRKVLFGNPDYTTLKLSPDGRFLSWLAPSEGVLNVWVAELATDYFSPRFHRPLTGRQVTKEIESGVWNYHWMYDNQTIIYFKDDHGDENWQMSTVNVALGTTHTLTTGDNVQAKIMAKTYLRPNELVIGLNDRDPQYHDPYLLNIQTGQKQLILVNTNFTDIEFDWQLQPRLGVKTATGGGDEYYSFKKGVWAFYRRVGVDDALNTSPVGFDVTGQILYWKDSSNRDKSALIWTDFNALRARVLYAPTKADLGEVERDPRTGHPVAITVEYDRQQWVPLGNAVVTDLQYLGGLVTGDDLTIVDTTLDYNRWIVKYAADKEADRYYLYDRPSKQAKFLFSEREDLGRYPLSRMHPLEVLTRDGLLQMCYLSVPLESDPSGIGRPNTPLPTVLFVHGGPWGTRNYWGNDPYVQLFTNRGYAALQCNFRGSTGFGKNYVNSGNREWGAKMHDDLIDAVSYVVQQRISDPQRVAIMGGSYGGYATLVGMTFTPEVFACGVDVVGPSNLLTLLSSIPSYWKPELELFYRRVGDPRTPEGQDFLKSRSPLFSAHRITKPLLIGQGANDPRVKQQEADQIVAAMKRRQLPVTYVVFPDEGHGFRKHENNLAFTGVMEQFLQNCLGGRAEPLEQKTNSSMQIKEMGNLNIGHLNNN